MIYTFSYWTFAWFVLYILHIIPYSPKFVFILEFVIVIIVSFIPMSVYNFIKFIVINIFIKGIPLWMVRKSNITKRDILFSVFIFLCYLCWVYSNGKSIISIYTMIYSHYVNGDEKQLIGGKLYDKIYSFLI